MAQSALIFFGTLIWALLCKGWPCKVVGGGISFDKEQRGCVGELHAVASCSPVLTAHEQVSFYRENLHLRVVPKMYGHTTLADGEVKRLPQHQLVQYIE
jgi:hypothetical protein